MLFFIGSFYDKLFQEFDSKQLLISCLALCFCFQDTNLLTHPIAFFFYPILNITMIIIEFSKSPRISTSIFIKSNIAVLICFHNHNNILQLQNQNGDLF